MKKQFTALLALCVFCATSVFAFAADFGVNTGDLVENSTETVTLSAYTNDFEENDIKSLTKLLGKDGTVEIIDTTDKNNEPTKALELRSPLSDSNANITLPDVRDAKGIFHFKADYRMTTQSKTVVQIKSYSGKWMNTLVELASNGYITTNGTNTVLVDASKWYSIDLTLNELTRKYTLKIDGVTYADELDFTNADFDTLMYMTIYPGKGGGKDGGEIVDGQDTQNSVIWLDNIEYYYTAPNYNVTLAALDAEGNIADVGTADYNFGNKLTLTFDQEMDETTLLAENFTLINAFGRQIPFTGEYSAQDKCYTITPAEALRPKTEYTVAIKADVKNKLGAAMVPNDNLKITTCKTPFAITAISGSVGSYNVSLQNANGESGYLVAASYSENIMRDIKIQLVSALTETIAISETAGDLVEFYLVSNDGAFTLIDKWGE